MMNPENLRAMAQMQNAMQQMGVNMPGFPQMPNAPGMGMSFGMPPSSDRQPSGNNSSNPGMDFSSLLNQFQSASVSGPSFPSMTSPTMQSQQLPPEQRYRMQLQSLNDMGFDDNVVNIRALEQTHGNVNRAVDVLLTGPPIDTSTNQSGPSNTSSTSEGENDVNNSASEASEDGGDKKNE